MGLERPYARCVSDRSIHTDGDNRRLTGLGRSISQAAKEVSDPTVSKIAETLFDVPHDMP